MNIKYKGLTFERLGHSTVRITTGDGNIIYLDPWEAVLGEQPREADVVLVSHDDRDHYDPPAIDRIATNETTIAAYERVDTEDLPRDSLSIPAEEEMTVDGISVRSVPAYNRPDGKHVRSNGEPYHPEGDGIGLVLTIGDVDVFFVGDSDFLDEHTTVEADVIIPPIGGAFTMDRHEAVEMVRELTPDLVLPVHYNTLTDFPDVSDNFERIETDADAFKREVESSTDVDVRLF
jgi:L-ascorbate metabolism protein UlaG (beta-lactamase superfamily)